MDAGAGSGGRLWKLLALALLTAVGVLLVSAEPASGQAVPLRQVVFIEVVTS